MSSRPSHGVCVTASVAKKREMNTALQAEPTRGFNYNEITGMSGHINLTLSSKQVRLLFHFFCTYGKQLDVNAPSDSLNPPDLATLAPCPVCAIPTTIKNLITNKLYPLCSHKR